MDLTELNSLFCGDEYFYNGVYLGVVKHIDYDYRIGYYILYFHDNPNLQYISYNYMLNYYKDKLKAIRMNLLASKRITKLVHFTPISNLESILENGICSRQHLDCSKLNFIPSDSWRLDNKRSFICNSITFPNYKMFYSKRMEDLRIKWAVLSIDSHILVDKFDTEFYRMNAASSSPNKCRFDPCSNDALEDMFYLENRDCNIPSNYTTDPQAEVLVKDVIDSSYINCIDTLGYNDIAYSLSKNFRVFYNDRSDLFGPRIDYRRW